MTYLDVTPQAPEMPPPPGDPDSIEATPAGERYPDLDWHALWNAGLDEPDWLVHGFLETRQAAALFARGGAGKSLLTLEMAACIATGLPFAGLPVRQSDVVYIDAENDPGQIIDRLKTFGFTPDQLDRLHYKSYPRLPALDHDAGGLEVLELAQHHDAELVVIDTMARTVAGPEQDADTFRAFARATGVRLKAAGIACWRLDHAGKDTAAGQRGSSAKNDDVDVVWQLDRDGDQRWTLKTGTGTLKKRSRHGLDRLQVARLDPDGLLSMLERVAPTSTTRTTAPELVAALDRLEVPTDVGRTKARSALAAAGVEASNDELAAAIRTRKERQSELSGDLSEGTPSGQVSGQVSPLSAEPVQTPNRTTQDSQDSPSRRPA